MPPTSLYRRSAFCLTLLAVSLAVGVCNCGLTAEGSPAANLHARVDRALVETKVEVRLKKLAEVGSTLALTEMTDALAIAESLGELRAHAVLRESAVKRWSQLAPAEAWGYVSKLPEGRGKSDLIRIVTPAFASKNIKFAAEAVLAMAGGRSRVDAIGIVAEWWAKSDIEAVREWVRRLPAGPAKETALYKIRFVWVHSDPAAAAENVRFLAPGDTKNALTMNIAGEWAARDPQKAIAWAQGLPDASEQALAFANIAESWADSSPRQAAEFAVQLPPQFRQQAVIAVVARWGTQDPKAAAEWVLQVPDIAVQPRGLAEVLNVWTSVDTAAPGNWVRTVESVHLRDAAVQAYIEAVAEWAPAAATRMALVSSDPTVRWTQVERCLALWWVADAAAATQWLDSADFPADNKRRWLSAHSNSG